MVGRTLGHYRIEEELGAGGMGVVYRATDTKLGRFVAIKVLAEVFGADSERLARFEREARLLAALNHLNIAAIYGLEESGGVHYLVLELVAGQTLNQRLAAGPLPTDEAIGICRQIAEALEAAHERGIVHRDLKPANIMITPEGKVKVLDFGLAKALQTPASSNDCSQSPTVTAETEAGVVMGTGAYMSPEQARGRLVDKRTDIWAFGCVLYELLAAIHDVELRAGAVTNQNSGALG
jgi:serine/threonine protein kinase